MNPKSFAAWLFWTGFPIVVAILGVLWLAHDIADLRRQKLELEVELKRVRSSCPCALEMGK